MVCLGQDSAHGCAPNRTRTSAKQEARRRYAVIVLWTSQCCDARSHVVSMAFGLPYTYTPTKALTGVSGRMACLTRAVSGPLPLGACVCRPLFCRRGCVRRPFSGVCRPLFCRRGCVCRPFSGGVWQLPISPWCLNRRRSLKACKCNIVNKERKRGWRGARQRQARRHVPIQDSITLN